MKILHAVEFYPPSVGGAQEVVRQVSEGLVARGHDVTVATTRIDERRAQVVNGVSVIDFLASGNAVRGMQGEIEEYRELVRFGGFDVMMFYAAQQWTTDAVLDLVGTTSGACVLAPCGFSGLMEPSYAEYFAALPAVLRRFDASIVHSPSYRDAALLEREGVNNVVVIANGASEAEFGIRTGGFREAFEIPEDEPLVVSVGSHTGLKGHAEAIESVRRTRPRSVTLAILGNESPGGCFRSCTRRAKAAEWRAGRRKRFIVANVPRPLVIGALHEADVVLLTSRIECSPLVLIEAMAAGTPFLAARVGNAADLAETSQAGRTFPTTINARGYASMSTSTVADELDALLDNPELRERMGAAGRAAWTEHHTWSRICELYEATYLAAVERHVR